MKYPKIIYLCNKTIGKNEEISSNNWKIFNPDYEIKLFDDEMIKSFLLKEYGQLYVDIINYLNDAPGFGQIKADFFRLCILYKTGGVYSDIDNLPLVSLADFIEKDVDFVTCSSYIHLNFNPNFIISIKENIILKNCIDWYIAKYNNKDEYKYWHWSIMKALTKTLLITDYKKEPGIYYLGDMKIQIIKECKGNNHYDAHNIYNGIRVFNNRQPNWDAKTHSFIGRIRRLVRINLLSGTITYPTHKSKNICIITRNTTNLLNDTKIYKKIFKKNGYETTIIENEKDKITDELITTDIVLFLDKIVVIKGNKKIVKIFMPNHELFKRHQYGLLRNIDLVLCKTQIGYDFFTTIKNQTKFNYDIININFVPYIPKTLRIPRKDIKKDPNLFIMFGDNTDYVIKNWITNDCYLKLNPDIKLVIISKKTYYSSIIKILPNTDLIKEDDIIKFKNITIYFSSIPEDIYKDIRQTASVTICSSVKEDNIHYINEARYFNSFIITINNSLFNKIKDNDYEIHTIYPDTNSLTEAIKYAINNKNKKIKSRKYFVEDLMSMKTVFETDVLDWLK